MLEYEIKQVSCIDREEWKILYIWDLPEWIKTRQQIIDIVEKCLSIGKIKYVYINTIVKNGKPIKYAFLYFHFWNDTLDTNYIKNQILTNKYIDIHGFLSNEWLFVFTTSELSRVSNIEYLKFLNTIGLKFTNDIVSMC